MADAVFQGETGRDVDGEWQTQRETFYLHAHSGGWVAVTKSDGLSAPTILEVPLGDLLKALGECVG